MLKVLKMPKVLVSIESTAGVNPNGIAPHKR
jgi:hypothetical protein